MTYLHRGPEGSYRRLLAEWMALRASHGVRLREVACAGTTRSLPLAELGPAGAPVVHVTAGVHGDEPASPWALLSLVRDGLLDPRFGYRLWPCLNPSGYEAGTRTNAEGQDINRSFSGEGTTPESRALIAENHDRTFLVAIDLHEDFESAGFYCYEPAVDGIAPLGDAVLRAIDGAGFAVQDLDASFDLGYPADPEAAARLRTLERGRVIVNAAAEMKHFGGLPISLYLLRSATRRYMTVETPRRHTWNDRIAMQRIAVTSVVAEAGSLAEKGSSHA